MDRYVSSVDRSNVFELYYRLSCKTQKGTVAHDQGGLVLDATSLESHVELVVAATKAAERAEVMD